MLRQENNPGVYTREVKLRLAPRQYDQLQTNARNNLMSIPLYVVNTCCKPEKEAPHVNTEMITYQSEVRILIRNIQGIATNLNQLARWSNTYHAYNPNTKKTIKRLKAHLVPYYKLAKTIEKNLFTKQK